MYVYRDFERLSSLPFYLGKPVAIVDSDSNDLDFGRRHSEGALFPSARTVIASRASNPAVLVVNDSRARQFASSPLARLAKPLFALGGNELYMVRAARQ